MTSPIGFLRAAAKLNYSAVAILSPSHSAALCATVIETFLELGVEFVELRRKLVVEEKQYLQFLILPC